MAKIARAVWTALAIRRNKDRHYFWIYYHDL